MVVVGKVLASLQASRQYGALPFLLCMLHARASRQCALWAIAKGEEVGGGGSSRTPSSVQSTHSKGGSLGAPPQETFWEFQTLLYSIIIISSL